MVRGLRGFRRLPASAPLWSRLCMEPDASANGGISASNPADGACRVRSTRTASAGSEVVGHFAVPGVPSVGLRELCEERRTAGKREFFGRFAHQTPRYGL